MKQISKKQFRTVPSNTEKAEPQTQAMRTRDILLAKNPNHFKELAAKAAAKKNMLKNGGKKTNV